ncbi:hypothetical protein AN958_06756 [Leucoagaricus sp. SymC.cos]|nr:hypothetical protein AN958_06756 [Leucoagaricus sp. SymC.cos]
MAKPRHHLPTPAPPLPPTSRLRPSAVPSAAVLSLLAGIVSNSPVATASPAPPPFLCPSLALPQSSSPATQHPSPLPAPRSRSRRSIPLTGRSHTLPYKFEQGDDGVWRHVDSYTLYGSTICPKTCGETTNPVSADEVTTSPNATDNIDLHDTLPAGWFTLTPRNDNRTTLILALSLVLAFFICFFIVGCLFWRKALRRKHKASDLEMRARRKRRSVSAMPLSSQSHKEEQRKAKGKQKIWAKATARWKDHARYTARLRRGKRHGNSRPQLLDSSTTLNPSTPLESYADDVASTTSVAPTTSRTVSRRPSSTSLYASPRPSVHLPPDNPQTSPPISVEPAPDVPSSPPAYRRGTLLNPITIPDGLNVPDERGGSILRTSSPNPSIDASSVGAKSFTQPQEFEPTTVPVHAAHVATDDKALLARLADLAERPPEVSDDAETSHQISVPVWEDEQLADFMRVPESSVADTSGSSSQNPFPPPPSKGKMAEPSYYAYRYSFEEFSNSIEPELEPSAPPFEAFSVPNLDDMVMLPSAPPLVEDGFPLEGFSDAPVSVTTAEHDEMQNSSTAGSGGGAQYQSPASSRPLSGGTLPGYHP